MKLIHHHKKQRLYKRKKLREHRNNTLKNKKNNLKRILDLYKENFNEMKLYIPNGIYKINCIICHNARFQSVLKKFYKYLILNQQRIDINVRLNTKKTQIANLIYILTFLQKQTKMLIHTHSCLCAGCYHFHAKPIFDNMLKFFEKQKIHKFIHQCLMYAEWDLDNLDIRTGVISRYGPWNTNGSYLDTSKGTFEQEFDY
jgi:hypothetical protein